MQKLQKQGGLESIIQGYGLHSALLSLKPMILLGRKLIGKLPFSYFKDLGVGYERNLSPP
jgi:hypothetical protein